MKLALAAFAIALAISVLPHPGGPYRRIPALVSMFIFLYLSGSLIGNNIDLCIFYLMFAKAPTSSMVTSGMDVNPYFLARGV